MSKCYPKLGRIWQKQWWEAGTGVTRKKENHGKFSVIAVLNNCHRICTSAGKKMNWEGTEVLVWKWSPVATSDKSKKLSYICFCSVTKLCPTLCNPMDYSIPGFLILPFLPVCSNSCPVSQWCCPIILSTVSPFSFCPQSFPASVSFPTSQLFTSGGKNTGVSPSASVLWKNIQGWFSFFFFFFIYFY